MSDIAIEGVRDGDLAEILRDYERFWGDRDLPRYLHHPMFFLEFGDRAFVARDQGTGEIAGYLLGFVAPKAVTSPENESSVAFHKRVGFTEMTRVGDYGDSGRTRIVMRKPLS